MAEWSLEKHVAADTAPSFICLAADDDVVPPFPNGMTFFGELQARKCRQNCMCSRVGGHGFSLHWTRASPAPPGRTCSWPGRRRTVSRLRERFQQRGL